MSELTVEFHGQLALLLIVHDGVAVVVRVVDHYLSILLKSIPWGKQHRAHRYRDAALHYDLSSMKSRERP